MAKILIVTDLLSGEEARHGAALSGTVGGVFKGMLAQAGVPGSIYEVTTAFPVPGPIESLMTPIPGEGSQLVGQYRHSPRQFLHRDHDHHVKALRETIAQLQPNLILALGDVPLWLLTGKTAISKSRGAPMMGGGRKMIATYHPLAVIRNWKLRPVVIQDLQKAMRHCETPELVRPRRILHLFPTIADIESFYNTYVLPAPVLSVDVETRAGQITEVGIATATDRALVIPFWVRTERDGNYWRTLNEEVVAWNWVRRMLSEKPTIGQNFQYDVQYFYRTLGIPVPKWIGDTMLLHHALEPELEKGLGFLGSIYTDEPSWKFMRSTAETLKKED